MKKLLSIMVLGLLLSGNAFALTKKEIQKKYGYNDDYICIAKVNDSYIIGNNDYVCNNDDKIMIKRKKTAQFNSATHYFLRHAKNNPNFPNDAKECKSLGTTCKDTSSKPLTLSVLTAMIGKKFVKPFLKKK
jgi:hypothetical protein